MTYEQETLSPDDSSAENIDQKIKSVIEVVGNILGSGGADISLVREKVEKSLHAMSVPFTRIDVEQDRNREDGKQVCSVRVYVPQYAPDAPYGGEDYFIPCWVPETTYEPKTHDY